MTKIIYHDKIYIPLKALLDKCQVEDAVFQDCITDIPNIGRAVSEEDCNRLIQDGVLSMPVEMTKVETLSAKINSIKKFAPLKFMFLSKLEKDKEKIIDKIQQEEKEEIANAICKISDNSKLAEKAEKKFQDAKTSMERNDELKKFGLSLQCITEIVNGYIGFMFFLAGKGIFYELYENGLEDMNEIFDTMTIEDNHICFYAQDDEEMHKLTPEDADRDFRDYTPIENICWCLSNKDVKNEFSDYICYFGDGIYFDIKITMIMKLINPKSFSDTIFINGIPETISAEEIVPYSI